LSAIDPPSNLVTPEEFVFEGAGNSKVHGWIIKPHNYDENKKNAYPMALLIHGGPEGAWNDDWSYRWNPQLFSASGYFTVMINTQGSTGYGQEFTRAILGNWGGAPYESLMLGVDYILQEYKQIDPTRLAVD
jgi:dipeptidyl aminopeptidase/acylaminoacyl peptidase